MKPKEGISVDAAASGNPGYAKYRGVDLKTKKVLFSIEIGISTNNIAEYLAVCHGVLYCLQQKKGGIIYTDSTTAMSWVKSGRPNTTLVMCDKTSRGLELLGRAADRMKELEIRSDGIDILVNQRIVVSKWYTSEWGESPADFGEKKKPL